MDSKARFLVTSVPRAPDCIVEVSGDLTGDDVQRLETWLWGCLAYMSDRLIVDLAGVTAIGSTGLVVLVEARKQGTVVGTEMLIRSPAPVVEEAIDAANLGDVLPVI